MSYGIVSNVERTGVEIIWETEECASFLPLSLHLPSSLAAISVPLSSAGFEQADTYEQDEYLHRVGSARLAGSSWRHEAVQNISDLF